jgi:hypothetical protein
MVEKTESFPGDPLAVPVPPEPPAPTVTVMAEPGDTEKLDAVL